MRHTKVMDPSLGLALWLVAFAAALVTIVLGTMLVYHWMRYAMNPLVSAVAIGVFAVVSGSFLVAIFGAATAFTL